MNSVSTAKLMASADQRHDAAQPPTSHDGEREDPGEQRHRERAVDVRDRVLEVLRRLGRVRHHHLLPGAATAVSASGWTISVNVRPLSLPRGDLDRGLLAAAAAAGRCCRRGGPSAVDVVAGRRDLPLALTSAQLTSSTFITSPCSVCRSKPTPVRSCAGCAAGPQHDEPDDDGGGEGDQHRRDDLAQVLRRRARPGRGCA